MLHFKINMPIFVSRGGDRRNSQKMEGVNIRLLVKKLTKRNFAIQLK